ncbi:MAG: BACON domain-containing carbohydrate-binding protein [Akkermansiaceae bacterium]|nr:BACON domain-containing carbohydrate-binding protein [Akkermansiaceae bacterium]
MNSIKKLLCQVVALCLTALPALAQVTIDPPTRSFTKDGGGGSILTSGTGSWTASTTSPWLTITPRTTGSAGTSCIYVVNSNLSAAARQGVINIAGTTHTVTQIGYTATLSPTSATVNLSGGARTVSITTSAGVSWTATTSTPWITVNSPSGIGSGTVTYTVANYSGVVTRTGSILIGGQAFSVSQTGTDVNIAPYSSDKAYSSDIVTVEVAALSATNWNVTSNASWISVVDPAAKKGNSTVFLSISTNPSFVERTGTVTIGSATFTIRQSGTPFPQLDILPKTVTAEPTGAFANIAVIATPDAPWTAESLTPWIFASGTSGAGNGNISYVASANPTLSPRTGTVRVYAPAVLPKTDLTQSLLAHIPTGSFDDSGWLRHLAGPIETRMDGSFRRELSGQDIKLEQDAGSVAVRFNVETTGAIQRLCGINANSTNTALYINANNQLVFQSGSSLLVSDFTVVANKEYQVVATASLANVVSLYAGEAGTTIRLAGTSTFASAPFRLSVATPAATVKIGYADLPSSGYLNGGVLKDFRLYGRALNSDEVTALFTAALTAAPYGPVVTPAINTVVSYNLRGQSAVTGGSWAPTGAAKAYTLSSGSNVTSTTSTVFYERNFNDVFQVSALAMPVTAQVTAAIVNYGSGNRAFWGGSSSTFVSVQFTYEDNTIGTTANSVTAIKGSISYISVPFSNNPTNVTQTLTFSNPKPEKLVKSVSVSANYDRKSDYANEPASFQNSIGAITMNLPFTAPNSVSGSVGWGEAQDRFSTPQRALKSMGTGEFRLWSQQSSFSGDSGTYSLWFSSEALPSLGTRWQLFKRAGLLSHLLTVELDSSGNIVCSDGANTVTLTAGIKAKQWQMLTFAGAFGANLTAFVDGAEVGNTNVFSGYNYGKAADDPVWMRIGGWSGSLGNVAFYDGALSSAQVKTIYDSEKAIFIDHVVSQGVVTPELSPQTATLGADGGTISASLTLASNVTWSAVSSADWLQITSGGSGSGSTTLQVFAAANPTVTTRSATITIAGRQFTVSQAGMPAEIAYTPEIFTTDGGSMTIDVIAGGSAQWSATSGASWLTVALGESGEGDGFVFLIADPYNNTSQSRTGSVTVAGKTLYFTQRGYALSISPQVAQIGSNSGAGEFGVAAPLSAVWEAVVTQPWITVLGSTTGIGNGTLRYTVAANETGATRSGKIIVSGQEYSITQTTSLLLATEDDGNGTVSGAGGYDVNSSATLTATAAQGYVFSHWTGDAVGSTNPLSVSMDSSKTVKAHFIPAGAATTIATNSAAALGLVPADRVTQERTLTISEVTANPNAFGLYNRNQMQGLALGQPVLERNPQTGKMSLNLGVNVSTDLKTWTSLGIATGDASVRGGKVKLSVTPSGNAMFYKLEGSAGN